ncbi:hypothetical protein [Roseibium sp.]|uniref:hypothetical protein n=1 Tax=Roseibium sp. TaxID=1936156 RepID=UPI003D132E81
MLFLKMLHSSGRGRGALFVCGFLTLMLVAGGITSYGRYAGYDVSDADGLLYTLILYCSWHLGQTYRGWVGSWIKRLEK